MTMLDQINRAETVDQVAVTVTDQDGHPVLFDSVTDKSCAVAYRCPMTGTDNCDGADAKNCPAC